MVEFLDTYLDDEGPPPPEGYPPNVRGIVIIVILLLSLVISMSFGAIRIYTKAFITRALGWDDCKSLERTMRTSQMTDCHIVDTCIITMVELLLPADSGRADIEWRTS